LNAPLPERLERPGFEQVWRVPCAGGVAFVAVHAALDGRAFGGIRIRAYPDERGALDDALALARAMSAKLVLADIRGGGAKSVLMLPPGQRAAAVAALGAFIQSLRGLYNCGPDLGFTADDDVVLREQTEYVAPAGMSDATAAGVESALRAASPEPGRVAVQGLGTVGLPLARSLTSAGVDVVAADLRPQDELRSVAPEQIHRQAVDVFAPCALGGVLNAETIPELRCRVICGGANNPLASAADGLALQRRGIVLVPDVLSTSAAAIVGASTILGQQDRIPERLAAIGPRVVELLARARAADLPPCEQAARMAQQRLQAMRAG